MISFLFTVAVQQEPSTNNFPIFYRYLSRRGRGYSIDPLVKVLKRSKISCTFCPSYLLFVLFRANLENYIYIYIYIERERGIFKVRESHYSNCRFLKFNQFLLSYIIFSSKTLKTNTDFFSSVAVFHFGRSAHSCIKKIVQLKSSL